MQSLQSSRRQRVAVEDKGTQTPRSYRASNAADEFEEHSPEWEQVGIMLLLPGFGLQGLGSDI